MNTTNYKDLFKTYCEIDEKIYEIEKFIHEAKNKRMRLESWKIEILERIITILEEKTNQ